MNQIVFSKQLAAWQETIEALTPYKPSGSTYQRSYKFVDSYTLDKLKGDPKKGVTRRLTWGNVSFPDTGDLLECSGRQNYKWTIDLAINYTLTSDPVLRLNVIPADLVQVLDTLRTDANRVSGVNSVQAVASSLTENTDETAVIGNQSVTKIGTLQTIITLSIDTSEVI